MDTLTQRAWFRITFKSQSSSELPHSPTPPEKRLFQQSYFTGQVVAHTHVRVEVSTLTHEPVASAPDSKDKERGQSQAVAPVILLVFFIWCCV